MKTVVSLQELVDSEIRPGRLIEEFRALTCASVAGLVAGPLVEASCPACGGAGSPAFEKLGLSYRLCGECASLFASPRPTAAALAEYARSSPASTFFRDRILGATLATRFDKLIRPRAEWVVDALAEYRPGATAGVDLSPQEGGFLAELAAQSPALKQLASADTHQAPWAPPGSVDFITAFDVLDRAADVRALVSAVRAALRPGGLFFVAAPSISGFDLQVLWERSPTILPPDKLNLLSVDGFLRLFGAPAWDVIELSTPGMFDVENVRQVILADPTADWPRVVREIVEQRDEAARLEFQEYLQRHRLASFARLVVRRR